jgi:hypothetical protein
MSWAIPPMKLYCRLTLLYMKDKFGYKPGDKIDERIKETIVAAKPIASGIVSCRINKFDHDYYDIVMDFETLLMTQ